MPVFEVYLDAEKVAVSGLEGEGVLTVFLSWAQRSIDSPEPREELVLNVGGIDSPLGEHLNWLNQAINFGSEIRIRPLAEGASTPPAERKPISPELQKAKEEYVRKAAAELGWEIVEHGSDS